MTALGWDVALFRAVHHGLRHPLLDPVMKALTDPGVWKVPLFGLAAALLLGRGRRGAAALLALVLTVTVSDQLNNRALKPLFRRPRPSVALADTRPLFGVRHSYSFPSSHAVNFFAAAPLVREAFPGGGVVYLVLASAVALSRVYVGDHYPSDVAVGALLGTWVGWLGRKALRRGLATWEKRSLAATITPDPSAGGGVPSAGP